MRLSSSFNGTLQAELAGLALVRGKAFAGGGVLLGVRYCFALTGIADLDDLGEEDS